MPFCIQEKLLAKSNICLTQDINIFSTELFMKRYLVLTHDSVEWTNY